MGHHFSVEKPACCVSLSSLFPYPEHVPEGQESAPPSSIAVVPSVSTVAPVADPYEESTDANTPYDSMEGLKTRIKVLRVIDGDTLDIGVCREHSGRKVWKFRVRLYGIDTPEKRPSRSDPLRDREIQAALRSKQALTDRLIENDWIVVAHFDKPDKYGRILCTLYDKHGENLNDWMIRMGYAVPYFGKTKKKYQEPMIKVEEPPSSEEEFEEMAAP